MCKTTNYTITFSLFNNYSRIHRLAQSLTVQTISFSIIIIINEKGIIIYNNRPNNNKIV